MESYVPRASRRIRATRVASWQELQASRHDPETYREDDVSPSSLSSSLPSLNRRQALLVGAATATVTLSTAAHASVAAIQQGLAAQHEATVSYVSPERLPHMTKMVYGVDDETQLNAVKEAWNKLIRSMQDDGNEEDMDGD